MRKYLLPENGTFYKANLHSHSDRSDGIFSPAEMKAEYQKRGYSVLAFSDHDALHSSADLNDDNFVALTAYEISIRNEDDPTPHALQPIVDLNLIAKDPHSKIQIGFHPFTVEWLVNRGKITEEDVQNIPYAGELRDLHLYPANINKIIKSANENGYLVSINHPMWSLTNYHDYGSYEGAWAVEVYNHSCHSITGLGYSENVYEDILRSGKKIFAVATDDNHNHIPLDAYNSDSFGGVTMIKAPALTYDAIITALENGDFYATTGPEIKELYYEDGKVHIKTSPAAEICMLTMGRQGVRIASNDGSPITEAVFPVKFDLYGYVRFRVTDQSGKHAFTNTFYTDELEDGKPARRTVFR